MKRAKRAIVVLLMAVIFIAGAVVADVLNVNFIGKKDIAVTTEEFKVKLVEISEMATLEYDYDGTFKYDGGSLQLLNPIKSKTFKFNCVQGRDMQKNDAVSIDAILEKKGLSGNVSIVSEVQEEQRKVLEYSIEF